MTLLTKEEGEEEGKKRKKIEEFMTEGEGEEEGKEKQGREGNMEVSKKMK